jgi:hypothetical protein
MYSIWYVFVHIILVSQTSSTLTLLLYIQYPLMMSKRVLETGGGYYRILRTIRRTSFFEKLPPKFRCVLYSKLI